jgi:hypothetical protein
MKPEFAKPVKRRRVYMSIFLFFMVFSIFLCVLFLIAESVPLSRGLLRLTHGLFRVLGYGIGQSIP